MGKDKGKDEHRTSNVQHRILNKEFCQFLKKTERSDTINRQSTIINLKERSDIIIRRSTFPPESFGGFDVGRSSFNMFDVNLSKQLRMA